MDKFKHLRSKKTFLALTASVAMLLASLPMAVGVAAGEAKAASNETFKAFATFDNEPNGVMTVKQTNGDAGGHGTFTIHKSEVLNEGEKAIYLQFDVKSTSDKPLELFFFKFKFNAGNYERPIKAGEKFYLQNTGAADWTEDAISDSTTHYGKTDCLKVPAHFDGKVRIPMTSFKGASAANDAYIFDSNNVDMLDIYMHSPNPAGECTFTFDNFGYVMATDPTPDPTPDKTELNTLKSGLEAFLTHEAEYTPESWAAFKAKYDQAMAMAEDTTEQVAAKVEALKAVEAAKADLKRADTKPEPTPEGPAYAETDTVRLNKGEKYFEITGFEDNETVKVEFCDRTEAAKNNGNKGLEVPLADGSQNGFKNFVVTTNDHSNWTGAKYLQFYIENTVTMEGANPLELFYIELNGSAKMMLNYNAKGIKLFDIEAGKWSDAEVVGNSFHVYPDFGKDEDGNLIKVPSLQIPVGFKGYVRIPLTDENFFDKSKSGVKVTDILSKVTDFNMYLLYPGIPGPNNMNLDDFGIITYEGDTAPEYENDPDAKPDVPDVSEDITVTLTGVLKDAEGNVMPNATVTLDEVSFVTNSKGEFKFEGVKNGYITMEIKDAAGTDLGFFSFNLSSGKATEILDGTITVAAGVDGITMQVKMGAFGPQLESVAAGALENVEPGTETTDPEVPGTDGDKLPETGVLFNSAVVAALLLALVAGAFVIKKSAKTC